MPANEIITTAPALVEKLKARPDRSIYESKEGDFWIDYQGGTVSQGAIQDAFKGGLIKLKWPDRPDLHSYILK